MSSFPLVNGLAYPPNPIGPIVSVGTVQGTDFLIGTGGPSTKSSIAARAAREGLVQSGTAGSTFANTTIIGTGAFTYAFWLYQPTANTADIISGGVGSPGLYVSSTGLIGINSVYVSGGPTTSAGAYTAGKWSHIAYVRTSTSASGAAFYVDGVAVTTGTDALNYTVAPTAIGKRGDDSNVLTGTVIPLIYNRALTAAEVVALYESGVPAGADYNSASNTSIITGDNSTFASDTGYWSKSGGTTIGSGSAVIAAGGYIVKTALLTANKKYRAVVVATAGGDVKLNFGGNDTLIGTGAGTYTYEFTAVGTTTAQFGIVSTAGCTIDTVTLFALGLLLAPDAAQAGGGLVWYDTSGNAANITLPASGVSWNVPSSRYLGGNWNAVGTFNVKAATNLNWFQTTGTAGAAVSLRALNDAQSAFVLGEIEASTLRLNSASGGNVLLGTTTDSGNGRIQLASHTTSAGGIGFGTDTSLYRNAAQSLQLDGASAPTLSLSVGGTQKGRFEIYSEDLYISTLTAGKSLILRSGNATTALTLDSSQRCILAGALRLNNAYTAGAPTATGYVTLQDSAGNTYKVLVGT